MDNEKYAKVIVKNNTRYTDNLFTYKIPEFLVDGMQIGHRVLVPFGKGNKPIEAYVFSITDEKEVNINYKEIFDILDEYPIFKEEDINLIKWMRNRYLCTFMDCILLLHPKGYKVDSFKEISLSREHENLDIESFYTKIDMSGSICTLLARGSIISMVSVIFILPTLLMLFDKIILKHKNIKKEGV